MAITLLPNNVGSGATTQPVTLKCIGLPASFAVGPVTMATILDVVFRKINIDPSLYDVSAAIDTVDGQMVNQRIHVRDLLDVSLRVFSTDLIEVDWKIKAQKRGAAVTATLADSDLGAQLGTNPNPAPRVQVIRKQDVELPAHGDLQYYSVLTEYEQAIQHANRETVQDVQDPLTINSQLVLSDSTARQAISRILFTTWLEKTTFQLATMLQWLYLAPGDVLNVTVAGVLTRMRIITQDISLFGPIPLECAADEVGLLTQNQTGALAPVRIPLSTFSKDSTLIAWSSNALRDADTSSLGFYCACNGTEGTVWNGALLYMSRDGGVTYQETLAMSDPSAFGSTSSVLAAPASNIVAGMYDNASTVTFDLTAGAAPVSCSNSELLSGNNTCLVGGEVIQFQTVTANGNNSYTLSNLIRGHRGTEVNWGGHGVGENIVFLETNGATYRITVDTSLFGKTVLLKAVTLGQAITDAAAVSLTISGAEFTPYAPCSLKITRNISNDIIISWIRRTRFGGAWTDFVDADSDARPLDFGEVFFYCDIMNGVSVAREFYGGTPSVTYTAAQQITDFGSVQSSITVRIQQQGIYGKGYILTGTG